MKKIRGILILSIIFTMIFSYWGTEGIAKDNSVYIIPIKGEIDIITSGFVTRTMDELNKTGARAIIFEIDTYGGLIDESVLIKDHILQTHIPTISFVNNKAESSGVLIAISCEHLVMAPNSTIGSAETVPNCEKVLSFWRAVLRDTAQSRDRDQDVIQAMADRDIGVEGIVEKGKLLNLTSREALDIGIADYISNDYNDILYNFGIFNVNIVHQEEGIQNKIAKFISRPCISSLLLTIALIGLVVEILTPGFGIGGTISIIGFALYFGGNIIAGNGHWISLVLFITGLILLIIEGIVPGFGLPGISGIILVSLGIVLAMDSFGVAVLSMSIAIIITTIVTIFLIKYGFRSTLLDPIILKTQHKDEKGYLSSETKDILLNERGVTLSGLRPSGFVDINGEKVDVLSDEGFIPKNTMVEVVRVEGSKIFVRRV